MAVVQISKVKVRRGQELQTGIPQLDSGEFGWAEDTEHLYIGKRIADGAVDNNNTRILTDNDLDNIFSLIGNTVTDAIIYKYRDDIVSLTHTQQRPLKSKLDDIVSLCDFGVVTSTTATDITAELNGAIQDLFLNLNQDSTERYNMRRELRIPAGNYIVSEPIDLPPYTNLVGEGIGLTTLTLNNISTNMFRTVDALDNNYSSGNMLGGSESAQCIKLSNLILEYSDGSVSSPALLSLDNVSNVEISNCIFRTQIGMITTATTGWGTGITMRGIGSGMNSGNSSLCKNILIENCQFNQLSIGIHGIDSVDRPVIKDCIFNDLYSGIIFEAVGALSGPNNGLIADSRFQDIAQQGIYVGSNPNNCPSNHISMNNYFTQVGNGPDLDEHTTSAQNSVITFASSGNRSENDTFNRVLIGSTNTNKTFYYNPIIQGSVATDGAPVVVSVIPQSTTTNLVNIPLTGNNQLLSIAYQLYNPSLNRKGELIVNIAPDGYSTVTDSYDYSEALYVVSTGTVAGIFSGVNLLNINPTVDTSFNSIDPLNNVWFITGDNVYAGKAAAIIANPAVGQYITDSSNPTFDFSIPGETYTLLNSDSPSVVFDVNTMNTATNNYVTLACENSSQYTDSTIEYQINTLS